MVSVATLHSGTPEPFERRFVTRFMGAETIGVGFYASWVSCRIFDGHGFAGTPK